MKQYNKYFGDSDLFKAQATATMLTRLASAKSQVEMVRDDLSEYGLVARDNSELEEFMPERFRKIMLEVCKLHIMDLTATMALLKEKIERENRAMDEEEEE